MNEKLTQEELRKIELFISGIKDLSPEEFSSHLASLATIFKNKLFFIFSQLQQDIETTLRIVREYLSEKVLSRDISDVSLENLETVLSLLTAPKRKLSNTYYEYIFNSYQKDSLNKQDRKFLKEAKTRLKLFLQFQTTIKDVLEFHIEIKKKFASVKITDSSMFKNFSLSMFDKLIDEKIFTASNDVRNLTPALKQPYLLNTETFKKTTDEYMKELEEDLVRLEQIEKWKKDNKEQTDYIKKLEIKTIQLQRMHRGVLFIAYGSNQRMNDKLRTLETQTYALEQMIDNF